MLLLLAAGASHAAWSGDITDGLLDPSFSDDGKLDINIRPGAYDRAEAIVVAPDGKLYLVSTSFSTTDPVEQQKAVVRLNADGSVDHTYGGGDGIADLPYGSAYHGLRATIQLDGKLLLLGQKQEIPQQPYTVCRLKTDGALDVTYGDAQSGCQDLHETGYMSGIALQPDGRAVVAGDKTHNGVTRGVVYRLDTHGNLDNSFDGDGEYVLLSSFSLQDIAVAPDGKLVVVGRSLNPGGTFDAYRLDPEGGLDDGFGEAGHVSVTFESFGVGNARAYAVSVLSDGAILVAGEAGINNSRRAAVAKLNPMDGGLASEFAINGIGYYDNCPGELGPCSVNIWDMFVQSDGRIVLAGTNSRDGAKRDFFVLRLLENGYADTDFGDWWAFGGIAEIPFDLVDGGDTNTRDEAFAVASHGGRIVVAGTADVADGKHFAVARLTNDRIFTDDYDH